MRVKIGWDEKLVIDLEWPYFKTLFYSCSTLFVHKEIMCEMISSHMQLTWKNDFECTCTHYQSDIWMVPPLHKASAYIQPLQVKRLFTLCRYIARHRKATPTPEVAGILGIVGNYEYSGTIVGMYIYYRIVHFVGFITFCIPNSPGVCIIPTYVCIVQTYTLLYTAANTCTCVRCPS